MLDWTRLEHISNEIDKHLRNNAKFTDMLRDAKYSLDEARHAREEQFLWELRLLKSEVSEIKTQLKKYGLPDADQYEKRLQSLKEACHSKQWPQAVDPETICSENDEKALERATCIIHLVINESLEKKKFLDIGCGQGHVVTKARELGSEAFGYDLHSENFRFQAPWFTSSFEEVYKNAPYDVILLHDVLDHLEEVDPIALMHRVKEILSNEGRVYIRNHPWSSRHGGHLYEQINKAFAHLVFDEIELTRMGGHQCKYNIKVVRPIETYRHWFKSSGFEIKSETPIKTPVEPFFLEPSYVHENLSEIWKTKSEMEENMEIDFVEYTLELPKESNHQII